MGWGTDFNTNIYLNRQVFISKLEVDDKISELTQKIEDNKSLLKMYASSTPNDIIPEDWNDDPIGWINTQINSIYDSIEEDVVTRYKLNLYSEYLEENPIVYNKEEKIDYFKDPEEDIDYDNSGLPDFQHTTLPPEWRQSPPEWKEDQS